VPSKFDAVLELQSDQISAFYERIRSFDFRAPLHHWKIDFYLETLAKRREVKFDVLRLRWKLWRSAYVASFRDQYERKEKPALRADAVAWLQSLENVQAQLRELSIRPDDVAQVMVYTPDQADEQSPGFDQEQVIEKDTRELLDFLSEVEGRIGSYLSRNWLPSVGSRGNRTDHFIRTFAEMSAIAWRSTITPELLRSRDRSDFVGIMGCTLDDLGYPRVGIQAGSDDWLYQRVGKYNIWK